MTGSGKPRILIFIDWFEPGYRAGGMLRSMMNMVERLKADYDFYIITRNREYLTNEPFPGVKPDCWTGLMPGVKVWYASKGNISPWWWMQLMRQIRPDTIYINGLFSFWFSVLPLFLSKIWRRSRIVIAPSGMLGEGALKIKRWKKRPFLFLMKRIHVYRHVIWHAASGFEKKEVENVLPGCGKIIAAPLFSMDKTLAPCDVVDMADKKTGFLKLCYISRITRKKNLLFALSVLREISPSVNIEMTVTGPVDDDAYWEKCKKAIAELPGNVSVKYGGEIPHSEIQKQLRAHHALFFPTKHENYGFIIQECLMAGRPVIISDATPWRNLHIEKAGWDISLTNEDEFVRVISFLAAQSQEQYKEYCAGAAKLGMRLTEQAGVMERYRKVLGVRG